MNDYVHGYSTKEATRLIDQASTLEDLLHHDSVWEPGSLILEAGCGVGAQTRIIAPKNPGSNIRSVDISEASISQANQTIESLGINNVEFQQADIFDLEFEDDYFDHVFVCFVLEHLGNPLLALMELKRVLKPGGSIMVIEGDHGSTYFHPDSLEAQLAIQCQVELQRRNGGDANIGRRLYPLLQDSGFHDINVSPRQVYVDDSKPGLVEGFTKNTFTAMIEGISETAVNQNLIGEHGMTKGIADLYRTTQGGGTFNYTFFRGIGYKK